MLKRGKKVVTYEQAVALAEEMARAAVREELKQHKQHKRNGGLRSGTSTTTGGILQAVISTTEPRIDGHITFADVVVSATIPIGFSALGAAIAAGAMMAGAQFDESLELWGRCVQAGGALGALRLVGDALNFRGWWDGTFGAVLDMVDEWKLRADEQGEQRRAGGATWTYVQGAKPEDDGRVIAHTQPETLPATWDDLSATEQLNDALWFANRIWRRQLDKLPTGQKAMRGADMPSGFSLDDDLHAGIFAHLGRANLARQKNNGAWELVASPARVKCALTVRPPTPNEDAEGAEMPY